MGESELIQFFPQKKVVFWPKKRYMLFLVHQINSGFASTRALKMNPHHLAVFFFYRNLWFIWLLGNWPRMIIVNHIQMFYPMSFDDPFFGGNSRLLNFWGSAASGTKSLLSMVNVLVLYVS